MATSAVAATDSVITLVATSTSSSITTNQMLYHKLKYINNQNHQINERVIIKKAITTTTTIETATELTTSSCKCLNNNNQNNNKNKYNKNILRKAKSMPNLTKQFNKADIINYDDNNNNDNDNDNDNDNHHFDNDNDNHNDKNFNYYSNKHKMPTLTTARTTIATSIIKTPITTATALATAARITATEVKAKEKNVNEMLIGNQSEIFIEQKQDFCIHYKRNVLLVTPCCNKTYKCRFCHDENEKHRLEYKSVKELICTKCQVRQKIQECCQNCGIKFGKYTCLICNLFDDLDKQQYHCDKCGICRVGGKENFFHCNICNICLPKHLLINGHRCIENISRSHCPICLVKIHTSRLPCYIPPCGHLLHNLCFEQLLQNGFYKCPICQMSLLDMTVLWEFLDLQQRLMSATTTTTTTTTIATTAVTTTIPTPTPTTIMSIKCDKKTFQIICNDCLKISRTKFHVIGLKCLQCGSYNTTANNNKNNNCNNYNINDNHNNNNNNNNNNSNSDNINNLNHKDLTLLTDEIHST